MRCGCDISKASEKNWIQADAVQSRTPRRPGAQAQEIDVSGDKLPAKRLILSAIVERDRALSSLTTEDAIAYRSFMRRPTPRERWVGPVRARSSPEWRPFSGGLSARSTAYALSVVVFLTLAVPTPSPIARDARTMACHIGNASRLETQAAVIDPLRTRALGMR